tara:strand:+ start:150 stop:1271 length:1122 start_codon:yes stop_codon:yes gene_type:complete
MRVILFFTYGISLLDWKTSGLLEREVYFYKFLNEKYNLNFTFITFGNHEDKKILNYEFIDVLPVYEYMKYDNNKILRFLRSFLIPFKFRKAIKDGQILKTNQLLGSWIGIVSKLKYKIPLITRTGYDLYTFSKLNKKGKMKQIFYYVLTKITLKYTDIYLVSSKVDKDFLSMISPKYLSKLKIRPNWIRNQKVNNFSERHKNKIISVGRLEEQKNFYELIDGLKDTKIQIDIYGEGSQKNNLLDHAKKQNVKLKIISPVSNDTLIEEIKNYKIFISSSKFEGNPKSLLEAMSCGCVVVTKENKNIYEIIENLNNGITYKDTDEIKSILSKYINNEQEWTGISNKAYEHVNMFNNLENIAHEEMLDYKILNFPD